MSEESYAPIAGATIEAWLLVEEITHRVANDYTTAIGSISRAASRCSNADARTALAGAARILLGHADIHRALQPPLSPGPTDLSVYLRALCGAIARAHLADRNIHLTLVEEAIEIGAEQCWRVGMIVSELITNAARHGFRQRGGSIIVELSTPDDAVQCVVTDDGRSFNPKPGRGTRITSALARELGGRIDWHFAPSGTTALLHFPSDRPASALAA
jgi:two-component sensor histidine kinase